MLDKFSVISGGLAVVSGAFGLTCKLVAQAATATGNAAGSELPVIGQVANITATGALVVFLLYTVPKWMKDFATERQAAEASRALREQQHAIERAEWAKERENWSDMLREELNALRSAFECRGKP